MRAADELGAGAYEAAVALATVTLVKRRAEVLWVAGYWNVQDFYAQADSMLRCGESPGPNWQAFAEASWRFARRNRTGGLWSEPLLSISDIMAGALDEVRS